MKKIGRIGFYVGFCLLLTLPVFAQGNENAEWQAIEDQRDLRRKAELLEKFIQDRQSSAHRPDADFKLIEFYVANKDYQKIMRHADGFRTNLPSADAASKAKMFSEAMFAAAQSNNIPKTVEFSGYALQADPNNLTVLAFLARANLPDPAKAAEHALKALTIARPATMTQENYDKTQGLLHGIVAPLLLSQQKFAEAQEHLAVAIKLNPKDQAAQFQYGFASVNLAAVSAREAQEANLALVKAMSATPTNQAEVDAAKAKVETASKQALQHRDAAIDALAKAVAIGTAKPVSDQAKTFLDNLYKSKAGSLDGEEQFIADKKKELGLGL